MAKWTGSKPGGPQMKNLIPLTERSEQEAREIRSKGAKACNKRRREQKMLREIIRSVLAMGVTAGKVSDPDNLYTLPDAEKANVPIYTKIVMMEVQKYLETGDTEARNWLFRHAYPDSEREFDGLTIPLNGDDPDNGGSGVRIHLIRGEKPPDPTTSTPAEAAAPGAGEDVATREDAGAGESDVKADDE